MPFRKNFLCLVFLGVCLVDCQHVYYPDSPCPGTFDYISDNGQIYGLINFYLSRPSSTVTVTVNFTIAASLPTNYVGRLEPLGSQLDLLQDANQGKPISYRVHFPIISPLPRLTTLMINGEIVCYGPGDIASPQLRVTTTGLHHKLYLKSGTLPINMGLFTNNIPKKPTYSDPNEVYNFNGPDRPDWPDRPDRPDIPDRPLPTVFSSDGTVYTIHKDSDLSDPVNNPKPPVRPNNEVTIYEVTRPRPPPTSPPPAEEDREPAPAPAISTRPGGGGGVGGGGEGGGGGTIPCGTVYGGNEQIPLIQNGQSFERGEWPWIVAIYRKKEGSLTFICSGTLISDKHVISAAHCMQQKTSRTSTTDIVIRVGIYNLEDWGDDIAVSRTITSGTIHDAYNAKTLANDIMVFTLQRRVVFNNNIRAACLWEGNVDLSGIVGATGVVTGWGQTEFGPGGHGEPRMVRMPIVSTSDCRASKSDFHKLTSSNTLCAGDRAGAGPCLGDSGGGLYILEGGRWRVRGIVSLSLRPENGDKTCNLNEYIVFTDTAKYLSWINDIIN